MFIVKDGTKLSECVCVLSVRVCVCDVCDMRACVFDVRACVRVHVRVPPVQLRFEIF